MSDHSDNINEIAAALAKAQGLMEHAAKGRQNPQLHNRYSTLADVLNACRPHLSAVGIGIVQIPSIDGDLIAVRTMLLHSSGQWVACTLTSPIGPHRGAIKPIEENRGVMRAQAIGSVVTYLRRYGLSALTSVASDDDDGNGGNRGRDDREEERPPERRPEPPARPTWTPDERAEYLEALAKMPEIVTESLVDDWQQSKDKPIAASMSPDTRRAFVAYLASAKGLDAINTYAKERT